MEAGCDAVIGEWGRLLAAIARPISDRASIAHARRSRGAAMRVGKTRARGKWKQGGETRYGVSVA